AVAAHRADLLALVVIPDLDGIIGPAAGQQFTVRLPAYVEHMVRVSFERFEELAAGDLENLNELVSTAGGQALAVRTEGHAENRVAVAVLDVHNDLARRRLEHFDLAVRRRRAASRCQVFAIAGKGQGDDAVGKPIYLAP